MAMHLMHKRNKWTNSVGAVHFRAHRDGQAGPTQVIDFAGKRRCPFLANSRGKLEGTLPGKA